MRTTGGVWLGVCFVLLGSLQTVGQSFEGVVRTTTQSTTQVQAMNITTDMQTTLWIKGNRTANEVVSKSSMPGVPVTTMFMIIDRPAGKVYSLNRKEKTYTEMPLGGGNPGAVNAANFNVIKTDRTGTMNGIVCSIYETSGSYSMNAGAPTQVEQQVELWVTDDAKYANLHAYFNAERELAKSQDEKVLQSYYGLTAGAIVKQIIKTTTTMEISGKKTTSQSTTTVTYDEAVLETVPEEKISIPPDFKKVEMPMFRPEMSTSEGQNLMTMTHTASGNETSNVAGVRGAQSSQPSKSGGLFGGLLGAATGTTPASVAGGAPGFEPTGTSADDFLQSAHNINFKLTRINQTSDDIKVFIAVLLNAPEKVSGNDYRQVAASGRSSGINAGSLTAAQLKDAIHEKNAGLKAVKTAAVGVMIASLVTETTQAATDAATLPADIANLLPSGAKLITSLPLEMTGFGLLKLPKVLDQVKKAKANLESAKEQAPALVSNLKELTELVTLLERL